MDCPDRERGQWIGDVSAQSPQVFFALDGNAVLLLRKAIMDFICLRKGDRLVGNVPGIHFSELPSQSLNAISMSGMIAEYYKYTGDKEVLELAFLPCVKYLKLWRKGLNGLIKKRRGNWYWFDHLNNIDERVLENTWYYSALKFALYMGNELGRHEHDAFLQGRADSIKRGFDKKFLRGGGYASTRKFIDERANAMSVLAGLASPDKYEKIRDVLISTVNCTPYMEGYVLEALCVMGYKDGALRRMMSRYSNLIDSGDSTLWEDFNILGTKNHAWSGSPLTLLYKYFAQADTPDHLHTLTVKPDFTYFKSYEFSLNIRGKHLSVRTETDENGKPVTEIENDTDCKIYLK